MAPMNADLLRHIRLMSSLYAEDWYQAKLSGRRDCGIQGVPESFRDEIDADVILLFDELGFYYSSSPDSAEQRQLCCVLNQHKLPRTPSWDDLREMTDQAMRASTKYKNMAIEFRAPMHQWTRDLAHYCLFRWAGNERWPSPTTFNGLEYQLIQNFNAYYRTGESWESLIVRSSKHLASLGKKWPTKFDYRC